MTKARALQVRLTIAEHEQLKALARRQGFASLAACLWHMGLAQDFLTHERVAELHRHLLGQETPKKPKTRQSSNVVRDAKVETTVDVPLMGRSVAWDAGPDYKSRRQARWSGRWGRC